MKKNSKFCNQQRLFAPLAVTWFFFKDTLEDFVIWICLCNALITKDERELRADIILRISTFYATTTNERKIESIDISSLDPNFLRLHRFRVREPANAANTALVDKHRLTRDS